MKFLIKGFIYLGIVAGAGYLAVNHIPSLRANILEIVNPQAAKRQELVKTLTDNLNTLNTAVSGAASAQNVAAVAARSRELIAQSKQLLQQLSGTDQGTAGIVSAIVNTVVNAVTGTPKPSSSASLTPSPCVVPSL